MCVYLSLSIYIYIYIYIYICVSKVGVGGVPCGSGRGSTKSAPERVGHSGMEKEPPGMHT